MIKNNDAYRAAITEIERTPQIIDKTGGIVDYGLLPEGFIETEDGVGKATFKIKITGKTKDLNVKVHLSKAPDSDWVVHKMKY